jgi:hypothetical protein
MAPRLRVIDVAGEKICEAIDLLDEYRNAVAAEAGEHDPEIEIAPAATVN